MKPVLLGEAPSRPLKHQWDLPLSGHTATWLCAHAGLDARLDASCYETLRSAFRLVNAVQRYEDAYPWTTATTALARARVDAIMSDWWCDDVLRDDELVIVALGRKAQQALPSGARRKPFFEWLVAPRARFVTIPHPSGLNHLYNAQENHDRASEVLREALRNARVGH